MMLYPSCIGVVMKQPKRKPKNFLPSIPQLMSEWDQSLNPGLDPMKIGTGSTTEVTWRCTAKPDHIWKTTLNARTCKPGKIAGCPYCSGSLPDKENNLLVKFPKVCEEWDWELNGELRPEDFTPFACKSVNWKCLKNKDHKWNQKINTRTCGKGGCPFCDKIRINHTNSLATTHPEIAKQFHPTKNGKKTASNVPASHSCKTWWLCDKGHEFFATPYNVAIMGRGCKICLAEDTYEQRPIKNTNPKRKQNKTGKLTKENNLLVNRPDLAEQFDLEKNPGITPDRIHPWSHTKFWWKCENKHSWLASPDQRQKCGCPYCSGNKPSPTNNLGLADPNIVAEFDYEKNDFKPEDVTLNSKKPVVWKCLKCKENWKAIVCSRTKLKSGCPRCSNKIASINNNFEKEYPELVKFWDYSLNELTPNQITKQSSKQINWRCECGHKWAIAPTEMVKIGGCQACKKTIVSPTYNLATEYPDIAAEFDRDANGGRGPEDVFPSSTEVINWKCRCGCKWSKKVNIRTASVSNCPACGETSGERKVRIVLEKLGLKFQWQYSFKDEGMRRLKYDFAVWVNGEMRMIEYHGAQHWEEWSYGTLRPNQTLEASKARDAKKAKYCEDNNIPLLVIPFWQINNIELILEAWLTS